MVLRGRRVLRASATLGGMLQDVPRKFGDWWWTNGWLVAWFAVAISAIACVCYMLESVDRQACTTICEGQRAAPRYDWRTGCWCEDARGFYNPADSR